LHSVLEYFSTPPRGRTTYYRVSSSISGCPIILPTMILTLEMAPTTHGAPPGSKRVVAACPVGLKVSRSSPVPVDDRTRPKELIVMLVWDTHINLSHGPRTSDQVTTRRNLACRCNNKYPWGYPLGTRINPSPLTTPVHGTGKPIPLRQAMCIHLEVKA
jgi:hypothetical protein